MFGLSVFLEACLPGLICVLTGGLCYCVVAEEYLLEDPKSYKFLSHGNLPIPGLSDASEYQCTKV